MQEMWFIFQFPRRWSRQNWPYPSDGEMAASCCVAALNRAVSPLFEPRLTSLCHFAAKSTAFMRK